MHRASRFQAVGLVQTTSDIKQLGQRFLDARCGSWGLCTVASERLSVQLARHVRLVREPIVRIQSQLRALGAARRGLQEVGADGCARCSFWRWDLCPTLHCHAEDNGGDGDDGDAGSDDERGGTLHALHGWAKKSLGTLKKQNKTQEKSNCSVSCPFNTHEQTPTCSPTTPPATPSTSTTSTTATSLGGSAYWPHRSSPRQLPLQLLQLLRLLRLSPSTSSTSSTSSATTSSSASSGDYS
eukprot:3880259-Amphidinium_carterae.2